MNSPLIMVIDESGTTNRPMPQPIDDFALGGILFTVEEHKTLRECAKIIADTVNKPDFKYKHVQKSTAARSEFLSCINQLSPPSGVFGLYTQGGSLINDAIRSRDAATISQPAFGEETDGEVKKLQEDVRHAHMNAILGPFVGCVSNYSKRERRSLTLKWDRRPDLPDLQGICVKHMRDQINLMNLKPELRRVVESITYDHIADGEYASIARLAGVIAGDIVCFFRSYGQSIWSHLHERLRPLEVDSLTTDFESLMNSSRLAVVEETLGDPEFRTSSGETCLIHGYQNRFIANCISFIAPAGQRGHLVLQSGSKWEIHQTPD